MYMVGKYQAQAEADIRQAKILNDLLELLAIRFGKVSKNALAMATVFQKTTEATAQRKLDWEGKEKHDTKYQKGMDKDRDLKNKHYDDQKEQYNKDREFAEWKVKNQERTKEIERRHQRMLKEEDGEQKESRNRNRIQEIRVQGDNVRHNLKMRQLYKDQSESFGNVMNMMTGMTGKGMFMGGLGKGFQTLKLGSGILDTSEKLRGAKSELEDYEISEEEQGSTPQIREMIKMFRAKVERLSAVQIEMREKLGMFGGLLGGSGDEDSKWAKRLEFLSTWAKKHKNGIIISAVSIGMMFMVFKKLLSVSPMLQKMLEVMGLAFNLILRPFGDFLGFILRPLAMSFLTMVMPFFQKAYPMLMKLGTTIGEALANWDFGGVITAVLEAFPPMKMITAIGEKLGIVPTGTVTDKEMDASEVLAVGATIATVGGMGIAGTYGAVRATKFGIGKLFGSAQKTVGGSFTGIDGGGNASDGVNKEKMRGQGWNEYDPNDPSQRSKPNKFANLTKHLNKLAAAKIAITTASKAMLAFKLSNPIGWALLGWEGISSAVKHFDPEMYQQMRESTEFMGMGREFVGLGEESSAEMLYGGYNWIKDSMGINNSILGSGETSSFNPTSSNGGRHNGGTNITFNIAKVEKGVDVNMIALQVKAVLETSNTRLIN